MISYVNSTGQNTGICELCRGDMPEGTPVTGIITGTINRYFDRDYTKAERVLCPDCSQVLVGVITVIGKRHVPPPYATTIFAQEAAREPLCAATERNHYEPSPLL